MNLLEHPAKYSDVLIPKFAEILKEWNCTNVLDPMAGVGKIAHLYDHGYTGQITVNEIEVEWVVQTPLSISMRNLFCMDAANMSFADGEFDSIVVSPCYGNRMADSHNARDGSKRYTYTHLLGRKLTEGNTGNMQWGEKYREAHVAIWKECYRVLQPGGIFVLNCKDHIRDGKLIQVSYWHMRLLEKLGFVWIENHEVKTPGMRHGENAKLRVDHENIRVFRKTEYT